MAKINALVAVVLTCSFQAVSQGIATDSIYIRNFISRDYRAALHNYTVTEDKDGIIYVANDNGVLEYDGSEWHLIQINGFLGVISIRFSSNNRMYVGGTNEFGYLEQNAKGQYDYHSLRQLVDDDVEINEVWQIVTVGPKVYFQSYEGIFYYDGEQVKRIPVTDSWLVELNGNIYLSTYNSGMSLLDDGTSAPIANSPVFDGDAPFKLLPGPNGKKVMLTEYNGVFLLDTTNFSFEAWEIEANEGFKKYGLYDGMMWDDSTYLFAQTENGLIWADKSGKILRHINKDTGLTSNYTREFARDKNGNLWVVSEGINHLIWPDREGDSGFSTLVRHIEVNSSIHYINSKKAVFNIDEYTPINSLTFRFATPGFDKADLQYSYYLEGFDTQWSAWNADTKKEYTNLENGHYQFHVKSRLLNGKESQSATISFRVPLPWYRGTWVYASALLGLIGLIAAIIKLRTAHLKNINNRLEAIIGKRTEELIEQKEQLHKMNEELILANTELDNFVYRSSHDLIAPLKSLRGLVDITSKEESEINRLSYYKMMQSSIAKLEDFIQSILEYSSNSNKEFERVPVNLNTLIDQIILDLKYFEKAEKVSVVREFDAGLSFDSDPKRLQIIISNLIANAIKYHNYNQESPQIVVSAKKGNDSVEIKIADNGQGIEKDRLPNIFNMFYRASENSQGSGLGLYIVKDTVNNLRGSISVESTICKGTTFTLIIPIS